MQPLIDADILRYEIGFAAEAGYRATTGDDEAIPSWEWVEECFIGRVKEIENNISEFFEEQCQPSKFFLTDGPTFRDDIAKKKPYKGTRVVHKPWHFENLTAYMRDVLGAEVCEGIEADDAIAIEHSLTPHSTIICSRDKDFRQVPGGYTVGS
jgi:hypothetical protein